MTSDHDIAPIVRSWLRSEPDGPADRALAAALLEVDATRQRSRGWPPHAGLSAIVRFGVAAAAIAIAVALGYSIFRNVGFTLPAPHPVRTDAPGATEAALPIPEELSYLWIAQPRAVPGLDVEDRLLMNLDSDGFSITPDFGVAAVTSAARMSAPTAFELETVTNLTGCELGDIGRYSYSLSPGGTVLSIASGSDDCEVRRSALTREWRRSDCLDLTNWCRGPMEAGLQSSLFFDPFFTGFGRLDARYGAMTYEVPDGWANASDYPHVYALLHADDYTDADALDCLDCPDSLWFRANPSAVLGDCSEERDPSVGTSAAALVEWLRRHPGVAVTDGPAISLSDMPTTVLHVEALDDPGACHDAELDLDHVPLFTHPGYTFGVRSGDRVHLMFVAIDADMAMLISIDSFDPEDLDAVIAETERIVESIRLTPP